MLLETGIGTVNKERTRQIRATQNRLRVCTQPLTYHRSSLPHPAAPLLSVKLWETHAYTQHTHMTHAHSMHTQHSHKTHIHTAHIYSTCTQNTHTYIYHLNAPYIHNTCTQHTHILYTHISYRHSLTYTICILHTLTNSHPPHHLAAATKPH